VSAFFGASLGTTGYLVENRAGEVNVGGFARDFDRFEYWGINDLEINFAEESLTWDYLGETLHFDSTTMEFSKAPFSVYRILFPSLERQRLFAGYWDTDGSGTWSLHADRWEGTNYHAPSYEPLYCWVGYDAAGNEISYDPANEAQYIADNSLLTSANATWGGGTGEFHYPYVTATLFTMYLDAATPPWGNKVIFKLNKPNNTNDIFTFTAPAAKEMSTASMKDDIDKINVVPNPYYGFHSGELDPFDRWVQFTYLPEECTIRIFDLAGNLVRRLEKNDPSTPYLQWDLKNHNELPVASGIYVYQVEVAGVGEKVGKIAIFTPAERLDTY
jgi:hypothetical protein